MSKNEKNEVAERSTLVDAIQEAALKWAPAFRMSILLMISILAVMVRVFSVIRFESIIHEFDPWFNFRTTKYLVSHPDGLYGLWNWFDSESWYPLGRSVGGTVYPGLMTTSGIIYWTLHKLGLPVDVRNVCVFLAPCFAAFTAIAAFLLTKVFCTVSCKADGIMCRKSQKEVKLVFLLLCSPPSCHHTCPVQLPVHTITKVCQSSHLSSRSTCTSSQ
jgi:hypothetical protein